MWLHFLVERADECCVGFDGCTIMFTCIPPLHGSKIGTSLIISSASDSDIAGPISQYLPVCRL